MKKLREEKEIRQIQKWMGWVITAGLILVVALCLYVVIQVMSYGYANLGGFMMWDDVEKYIVGTNLILDTSMLSRYITCEQCERIIRRHGFDKVVCGSDSPWEDLNDNREFLLKCGFLDAEIAEMDNTAKRLLRL